MKPKTLILYIIILMFVSCVPARQFQDEKTRRENCEKELNSANSELESTNIKNNELAQQLSSLRAEHAALVRDTTMTANTLRNLQQQYDKINELQSVLIERNRELLAGNQRETSKLSTELQLTQENLQRKEDELNKLERELNDQKRKLDDFSQTLTLKEKRINELENILSQQDKAVKDLRAKVSNALLGFENNGLTIEIKNGKVYVSLDESLLFASGSWSVNAKGRDAIIRLAKVLETNTDVNILIEGHTDNVPLRGSGLVRDNWDLSVMRATAIVKIIVENSSVDPKRLTAAGRSEYHPIDTANTPAARQKNRRTEIILTPKLDELFKILEIQ